MKKLMFVLLTLGIGMLSAFTIFQAQTSDAVEYVKICTPYTNAAGYFYIPGTDICLNSFTGNARETVTLGDTTTTGVWQTTLPYPEGKWVSNVNSACGSDRLVKLGTFHSTDFTLNPYGRKQTAPITLKLKPTEAISRVIVGGGFFDPRLPNKHGVNGYDGVCVRSIDPTVLQTGTDGTFNPPYGNGGVPIGCVSNSRIVNMPGSYAISSTAAYPDITTYFLDAGQTQLAGPYIYGTQLVLTTDMDTTSKGLFCYYDATTDTYKPMAGTVTASVCVQDQSNY